MGLKSFFKSLGKTFTQVGKFILSRITDDQLVVAMLVVREAAGKFIDNTARREWAVAKLISEFHLSESLARWLVETAILQIKAEANDVLDTVEDKAKASN